MCEFRYGELNGSAVIALSYVFVFKKMRIMMINKLNAGTKGGQRIPNLIVGSGTRK